MEMTDHQVEPQTEKLASFSSPLGASLEQTAILSMLGGRGGDQEVGRGGIGVTVRMREEVTALMMKWRGGRGTERKEKKKTR